MLRYWTNCRGASGKPRRRRYAISVDCGWEIKRWEEGNMGRGDGKSGKGGGKRERGRGKRERGRGKERGKVGKGEKKGKGKEERNAWKLIVGF